jgi:hypothetical protein
LTKKRRKGSAEAAIAFIIFGFLMVMAVQAVIDLGNLDPFGHKNTIELFMAGLLIFGTFLGVGDILS